ALLPGDADRRRGAVSPMDGELGRLGRFRDRAGAQLGGGGGDCAGNLKKSVTIRQAKRDALGALVRRIFTGFRTARLLGNRSSGRSHRPGPRLWSPNQPTRSSA